MSRMNEREIARKLAEREELEPPAGLLEKIKGEIPPTIPVGVPGLETRRPVAPPQRWLIAASLVILFIELLKSTTSRKIAIINHSLSMVLFIVCLVEFLLFPAFATSAFFLVTSMVLLDVLAGFIVTIVSSRRDIGFSGGD
jgi:hypothetical protein